MARYARQEAAGPHDDSIIVKSRLQTQKRYSNHTQLEPHKIERKEVCGGKSQLYKVDGLLSII